MTLSVSAEALQQGELSQLQSVFDRTVIDSKPIGKISSLERLTNGVSNRVYRVNIENSFPVILKIFTDSDEANRNSILKVNHLLVKNRIPTSEILILDNSSHIFTNGYIVSRFVEGADVQDVIGKKIDYPGFYSKLGALMKRVHLITFSMFGILGGTEYSTYIDFMKTRINTIFNWCGELNLFTTEDQKEIGEYILDSLEGYKRLPAVLTHNDISQNNCRLSTNGELILIDWEDPSAQIWLYDFSIMTYWMLGELYDDKDSLEKYRLTFLKEYGKEAESEDIRKVENAIHIFYAIGLLAYYKLNLKDEVEYTKTKKRFIELMKNARITTSVSFS